MTETKTAQVKTLVPMRASAWDDPYPAGTICNVVEPADAIYPGRLAPDGSPWDEMTYWQSEVENA